MSPPATRRTLRVLFSVFSIIGLGGAHPALALSREVAITLDDLPTAYAQQFSAKKKGEIAGRILDALKEHSVQATGFAIGRLVTDDQRKNLDRFIEAGHVVGNHGFQHLDFGTVDLEAYKADFLKAEALLTPWMKGPHYFRFPFLRMGDTTDKAQGFKEFLKERGYRMVHATVSAEDWQFNQELCDAVARGEKAKLDEIGKRYLQATYDAFGHYEDLARKTVGRDVKHIFLIHMNYLNSLYLPKLLSWLRENHWKFISVADALKDPIYEKEPRQAQKEGGLWLGRIK